MKIGILTHHYVSNYGAFLQAYCLEQTLREMFASDDVRVIDYINRRHVLINTAGFLRFSRGRETLASWIEKNRLPGVFAKARRDELRLTKRVYNAAGLNDLGLDAIVVGSDEVWNYQDVRSFEDVKFGCGISEKTRLISYAASVGGIRSFKGAPERFAKGLGRFFAISVRDDNTGDFVRQMGIENAVRVLDPVFLHETPSAKTARVLELIDKPYILFYHCAPLSRQAREGIARYAGERGLRILGAGEYDTLYSERSIDLTPFEWAEMFRNARYVVTGTFHGAVLSIVNERGFSVCPNNPTRAEKLKSLLEQFSLSGRIVAPEDFDIRVEAQTPIDYTVVTAQVESQAQSSREFLKNSLTV